ncbi:MAG: DNA ligase [Candidatus Hydrogenedentes bacterium]|nr:DNA ligase [Candidatus Hydrogenedentota bacterium]
MARKKHLDTYHEKRDFSKTPEPKGAAGSDAGKAPIFVIQKHDARQLHYDFRLEVDGVLKSWAVPKGPSTNPKDKRLAVQTEDHPLEYAAFEGTIPEGEYGGGTVMVWDTGTYRNIMGEKDEPLTMEASLEKGHVEVWLEGQKIRGSYALIRTAPRGGKANWLLVKMKDDEADARRNPTSTENNSVLTQRTMKQIADGKGE